MRKEDKELNYPVVFYENRLLAYLITIIFAIAFFISLLFNNAFQNIGGLITALLFIAGVCVFLVIILMAYPSSYITINKDYFIYQKGKLNWQASWDEVEVLYVSASNTLMGALQIKTKSGSTKLISVPIIMKKGSSVPNLWSLFSLSHIEFAKKFKNRENKDARELMFILEKLSNKKIENYKFTGREKIRKQS